ncbi:MAG: nucleotidyltransferase family protein [Brevundimonas sp.]
MRRDEALAKLRSMEPSLRGQGVSGLYLFGSVARDEATSESDVDVAFDIAPGAEFDAWDQGRILMDIADALGTPVDLVERRAFSNRMEREVEADLIQVF